MFHLMCALATIRERTRLSLVLFVLSRWCPWLSQASISSYLVACMADSLYSRKLKPIVFSGYRGLKLWTQTGYWVNGSRIQFFLQCKWWAPSLWFAYCHSWLKKRKVCHLPVYTKFQYTTLKTSKIWVTVHVWLWGEYYSVNWIDYPDI